MRRKYIGSAIALVLLATAPGCAAVVAALPTIITAVTDATLVLGQIQHFADLFFKDFPDATKQKQVDEAIAKCEDALSAAEHATVGGQDLTQEQIDAAFDNFKTAYQELMVIVGPLGVMQDRNTKTFKARPGRQLFVPHADAMVPKIKRGK